MLSKVRILLGSLFVAMLVLGFQNCSGARFTAMEESNASKLGDGLEDKDFPEDEVVDNDTPVDDDDIDEGEEEDQNNDEEDLEAVCGTNADAIDMNGADVTRRKVRGGIAVVDVGTLTLSNVRGAQYAQADAAKRLWNLRGNLCLMSTDDAGGSPLDLLRNHRGAVKIVGFDTTGASLNKDHGDIVNTRGALILDDTHVGVVRNHRGKIVLLNGASIDTLINHRGPIVDGDGNDVSSSIPNQENVRLTWRD